MNPEQTTLNEIYKDWEEYQNKIIQSLTPLTAGQLALRAAPSLRSIGEIATHMIGARARWIRSMLGEGGDEMQALTTWDRPESPVRSAPELGQALGTGWKLMSEARQRWTPADWDYIYRGDYSGEPYELTRRWIIWHLIEHDLHHGGEISLTLGMHGLTAPDI